MAFVFTGAEAEISLEVVLRGHYQGKFCHQEIDLVEAIPPPVYEKNMQELTILPFAGGGNASSSGPTSLSQSAVEVISQFVHQFCLLLVCL